MYHWREKISKKDPKKAQLGVSYQEWNISSTETKCVPDVGWLPSDTKVDAESESELRTGRQYFWTEEFSKKYQKLIISRYCIMNNPNYQPQGNIAGPSVELIQMQNLMLNPNLHSKLPGNTWEERNFRKNIENWSFRGSTLWITLIINLKEILPGHRKSWFRCRIWCWIRICIQNCTAILEKKEIWKKYQKLIISG